MSKKQTILVIAILLVTTLSCNALATPAPIVSPPTASPLLAPTTEGQQPPSSPTRENQPPLTEAEVPRVTPQDAKAAFESGEAIIVDVRNKQVYDISHIKGAILIPLADIENNLAGLGLDKKQWIITYCT